MILLRTSVISTVLIILVLFLCMLLKDILSKKYVIFLWYIVVLRSLLVINIPFLTNNTVVLFKEKVSGLDEKVYGGYTILVEKIGGGIQHIVNRSGLIWMIVFSAIIVFLVTVYLTNIRRFSKSAVVHNKHIERWQSIYCKKQIVVRSSNYTYTPLTYGIIRPVILLPGSMDLSDTRKLRYVFLHEYVHICHRDIILKMLLLLSLAVHWFNPFMWIMFYVVNSDIEYACDESVLEKIGVINKKRYAALLVEMAECSLSKFYLCNHLSDCILEKRVVRIMRERKLSVMKKTVSYIAISALFIVAVASIGHREVMAKEYIPVNIPNVGSNGNAGSELIIETTDLNKGLSKQIVNSEGQVYYYDREMSEELGDSQQDIIDEIYNKTGVKVTPMYGTLHIKSEEDFLKD